MSVSLIHCDDYEPVRLRQALDRAVEAAGGWSRFVPRGGRVLVKPNLLMAGSDRCPVPTHPQVIRAAVEAVRDAGGTPIVFDQPAMGSLQGIARKLGFADLPLAEPDRTVRWRAKHGPFGEIERYDFDADAVINLAKFKTHGMMGLTLAVKNLFGLVKLAQRIEWHFKAGKSYDHFAGMLVEIALNVRPALNVIDAVIAMEGNGPNSGTPRPLRCLMASADPFSLDVAACRLVGWPAECLAVLAAARRMGVQFSENPEVAGDSLEAHVVRDFRFASDPRGAPSAELGFIRPNFLREWVRGWFVNRPVLRGSLCEGCGRCASICPAKALAMDDGNPVFDLKKCIRCFCCQEMCEKGAIVIRRGLLGWWIGSRPAQAPAKTPDRV